MVRRRRAVRYFVPLVVLAVGMGLPSATGAATAAPATATGTAYLTLLFGRTQWAAADDCTALPGAMTLDQIAQALQPMGLTGVGDVIIDNTGTTSQVCLHKDQLYPTWSQLQDLQSTYGWNFVSGGATHGNITTMTPTEQYDDSCGTLTTLSDNGFTRAWGLFAYPDNHYNTTVQTNVVSTCFAYGRKYGSALNVESKMAAPWFQETYSIHGGSCNDETLPCYVPTAAPNQRYLDPSALQKYLSPKANQWSVLQGYRFVTGANAHPTSGPSWDCSSSDWTQHWTSEYELYCWSDYLAALQTIPAGVVVTDPATVATAWGRTPDGSSGTVPAG